eukprot:TCONS_00048397-protein
MISLCFIVVLCSQLAVVSTSADFDFGSIDTSDKKVDASLQSFFEMLKKDNERKQQLCMKKYSPKRFRCCEGRAHFIPSRRIKYLCCRGKAYVPTSHLCCGMEVQRKVVSGQRTGIKKCCAGKNPYEPGKELCCNKEVISSKRYGCCRNKKYERAFATCCSGKITPILSMNPNAEIGCCGDEAYDMKEKICCAGKLGDFVDDSIGVGQHQLRQPQLPHISESGRQHTRCCNNQAYDSRTKMCCNGLKKKEAGLTECCFGRMIDPTKVICCNYGIQELKYGKNTGCCRFDNYRKGLQDYFEIYNTETQICCGGKLEKREHGASTSCCIQRSYNVDTHVCCKEKARARLYKKNPNKCENYRCCGRRMYCNDKLICCAGDDTRGRYRERIHKKTEHSRCCGLRAYNRVSHKCDTGNKVSELS